MKPINECKTVEELLGAGPERWIKELYYADKSGKVGVLMSKAYCFCVTGAIEKVYPREQQFAVQRKVASIIQPLGFNCIEAWNDAPERTYEEVMEVVRKAGI